MAKTFDVCIRGAGIVGRTLALQLAALRLRVALVRGPLGAGSGHSDVRAYALSSASRAVLERLRCWPDELHATPVVRMDVRGDAGGRVQFSPPTSTRQALNWIVDVPVLEQLLAEAVRFQPLIELLDEPPAAALTVVCEGRASTTRAEFGIDFDAAPYHQNALATRVRCELPHGQVARQWFANGEILALLPMEGAGGKLCALVWSTSAQRTQELLSMEPAQFCLAVQESSQGTLGPASLVAERSVWSLQSAQAGQWCGQNAQGSWVLAGDAAHNVHPLAGQGLNLGLGDAAELARQLELRAYWRSVGDLHVLRHYARARKAELALIGGAGDALQRIFQNAHPAMQTLRNWGMNGFERSGFLKQWVARRAMGQTLDAPNNHQT